MNLIKEKAETYGYNSLNSNELAMLCGYKGKTPYEESDWFKKISHLVLRNEKKAAVKIDSSRETFIEMQNLSTLDHEEFWILLLNKRNYLKKKIRLTAGGTDSVVVDIKLIFNHAILNKCSSIVVCHNHPSGEIRPSEPDKRITQKIKEAGRIIGIELLDHIIIGDNKYYSFSDEGGL